jgi:ABC-2 type transport system ATP-binding protein
MTDRSTGNPRFNRALAATAPIAALALTAACAGAPSATPGGTGPPDTPAPWSAPTCARPVPAPPSVAPVPGAPADHDLTSFDGTTIRLHWFPLAAAGAERPAPTVLLGPGWSMPGDTQPDPTALPGAITIGALQRAGYNVLTWDPRGFGDSSGTVQINSPGAEGRDVQRLLDWVATQPGVLLDRPGDPRTGMVGVSYGGGIQIVAAADDCRVDAIVPTFTWHSMNTSLYKAETFKAGWANVLLAAASGHDLDPHETRGTAAGNATGVLDPADTAWFAERDTAPLLPRINVPVLFVQGTVDTLFTLDEAVRNFRVPRDRGVPTALLWVCSGHGVCLTDAGDRERMSQATRAWLDRWVKGDRSVTTGPTVDIIDQNGTRHPRDDYPVTPTGSVTAEGRGTLALVAGGGAGPLPTAPAGSGILGPVAAPITPTPAANAVNVGIDPSAAVARLRGPNGEAGLIVGAPRLTIAYRGSTPGGGRPTRVFAQLVDDSTGTVLGNQITPIPVTLDSQPHETTADLEIVAFTPGAASHLTLQLVATTVTYAEPRLGGSVQFDRIHLELPVTPSR